MGIIKDVILHDQEANKQEPSKYDEALAKYNTDLDDNAVREAVRKIIAEKVPQNDTEEVTLRQHRAHYPQDHRL